VKVALVYVFPTVTPDKYIPAARKFVDSYTRHPPGSQDHDLHVIVNGEQAVNMDAVRRVFDPLAPEFSFHNNWAKDLGAFIVAAESFPCDLLICAGAHVNFWASGWLDVMTRSYAAIGPAVYGAWAFQEPTPHIRTTLFWCPPELLASYPYLKSDSDRYSFEHGPNSIALWSRKKGFEPFQVTWRGAYSMKHWHAIELQEALARDQHTATHQGE